MAKQAVLSTMFRTACLYSLSMLIPLSATLAQPVERNDHVRFDVAVEDGNYHVTYRFQDPFMNYQTYTLTLPRDETDAMIEKFGIPRWLFEPYVDNEPNRAIREGEMAQGLFTLNKNYIEVDKNAVLAYYSETYGRPIAGMIVSSLGDYGADTRRNRIEFTMRFIQDIPYGIPEFPDDGRHYGGVFIPPKLLIEGYGDCDSKVLLFVSILIHLIPADDIIFLNQPDHVLSAIREEPEKGQTIIRYKGDEYLVAETAGPGKRMLGQKGNYYRNEFRVEELTVSSDDIIPQADNSLASKQPVQAERVHDNILVLQNNSSRPFQFQISPDNHRWESLILEATQTGRYIFEDKMKIFLRIRKGKNQADVYRVSTGRIYTIQWNSVLKKWELAS